MQNIEFSDNKFEDFLQNIIEIAPKLPTNLDQFCWNKLPSVYTEFYTEELKVNVLYFILLIKCKPFYIYTGLFR